MVKRNTKRWRRAKKYNQGIQFTLEFYVPVTISGEWREGAKDKLVETINMEIDRLRRKIENMDGILKVYQDV